MSKPYTKKMLTVMITVAMVFSALAIVSFAAQPAYAASGTFTVNNPTTYTIGTASGVSTIAFVSGGTFGSGSVVFFFLSSTTSSSGIVGSSGTSVTVAGVSASNSIGGVALAAGTTTLNNKVTFTMYASAIAGSYYILAEDFISGSPSGTYALGSAVTLVTPVPTVTVVTSPTTVGSSEEITGSSFDAGASVTVYLNYPGSSTVLGSTTAASSGAFDFFVTIPALVGGTYHVIAQETNTISATYAEGGITADTTMTVAPAVTVSPASISGSTSSTFTVTGTGFPANDSFKASTSLNPINTITVGGVNALVAAFSSDSTGTFTASVTGLTSAISTSKTQGSYSISVTDSTNTPYSSVGSILVSIPNPTVLGFNFAITPTSPPLTSPDVYVNDSVTITVWDFPASQSTQFMLGSTSVGTLTTDVNGAGTLSTVIPAIPAGIYKPTAVVSSAYINIVPSVSPTSITVYNSFQVVDSAQTTLTTTYAEYLPTSGDITVQAYGLIPTTNSYDFADSGVASGGVGAAGLVTSLSVGTESSSTGEFTPAANGTLIFTYSPGYASLNSPPATGTAITVTSLNSVHEYGHSSTGNFGYKAIGAVTFTPSNLAIEKAGSSVNLVPSGLVPYNAHLYPGVIATYNVYVGTSEQTLSFKNHGGTAVTGTTIDSGDSSISFTAPSSNGLYNLSIAYSGMGTSTAPGVQQIVVSATGSSASAGSLVLVSTATGYDVVGYGYSASPDFYYASYGNSISSAKLESITNNHGAFVDTSVLGSIQYSEPAGTYYMFTVVVSSGTNYYVNSSYTVSSNLSLSANNGNIGSSITVTAYGLVPTTSYNVYFGTNLELSNTGTSLGAGSQSFNVPVMAKGTVTVSVDPVGSSTATETAGYQVKANSAITLGTSSQYAFPGQLETFSVTGFTAPNNLVFTNAGPTEYFAQIAFNGTLVATVPASFSSGTLSGSFVNPNNAVGSYYELTITGYEQASALTSTGGSITGGSVVQAALTGSASDFFGLVSGNGALLTGITSSEIATLEADINSTVSTSLTVPISQLNAAITSINGAVATLKTTVGNITADLSTINATVSSIESGQVTVLTDLGSISTSLASLNASLVAFNNNVVTINTTLGQVVTSLGSINTTVAANSNGIATVKTDLGTLQGQIVSTNGNVSSIKTSLGTLTTNVSNVSKQTQGFPTLEIFLIVIIVLVLITLVISFLAVSAANKAARRVTEEKKL